MKSGIFVGIALVTILLGLSFCVAFAEKTNANVPANVTNATNISSNVTNETKLATNPFAHVKGAIIKKSLPNETNSTNATTKIVVVKR